MTRARTLAFALLLLTLVPGVAEASWYDDYDAGINAARAGNWSVVVSKMSAAIKGNANENNKARTYGAIFINYKPYYYRGIANLNLGKYEQAISDLEKTMGPGELDLGPISSHLDRAKSRLAAASEPAQDPTPAPVQTRPAPTPAVVTPTPAPVTPTIDPALKQRASTTLAAARQKMQAANGRRAGSSPQFTQGMTLLTDATTRNATARSNDDFESIISIAENAGDLFDMATAPAPSATSAPAVATTPITPRPAAATGIVLGDTTSQVRRALENYFAGEFDVAAREFERLSRDMPKNGWIRAFLGASLYSQYAFEADVKYRDRAIREFREAKRLRSWKGGLPEKYFSKKIRKAFNEVG